MKKLIYFASVAMMSLFAASCDENINPDNKPDDNPGNENIEVTDITINAPQDTLFVGDTMTLAIQVLPENATNKAYELSVNEDGKKCVEIIDNTHIVGLKAGTAHITATASDNGKSSSVKVIVKEDPNAPVEPDNGDDKPVEPEVVNFEFEVAVDGIDVMINITAKTDSAYFVTFAESHYLQADSETKININQQVLNQIDELIKAGKTLDEILYSGDSEYNFYHDGEIKLRNNEYYTVYAVVIKGDENTFSLGYGNTVEFKTQARGSYEGTENILTIGATSTDNTITVNVEATTDEAYYLACMTEDEYNLAYGVSTDSEIMGSIYFHYYGSNIFEMDVKKDSTSKTITFENLASGTSYVIAAFGYLKNEEVNKPTTKYYTTIISTTGTAKEEEDNSDELNVVFKATSASVEVGKDNSGNPYTDGKRYSLTMNTDDENVYVILDLFPATPFQIEGSYNEVKGTENGIGQLGGAYSRYYFQQNGENKELPITGQCEITDNGDGTHTITGQGEFTYLLETIQFSYTGPISGWPIE